MRNKYTEKDINRHLNSLSAVAYVPNQNLTVRRLMEESFNIIVYLMKKGADEKSDKEQAGD